MRGCHFLAAALVGFAAATPADAAPGTLAQVRQRGYVICGASQGTPGFGIPDENGYWHGLDVDTCRAVAAAVFGDKEKARFVPLTGQQRLTALQTGEVDILPRTTTWTLERDANGVNFTMANFYDYVGFMVRKSTGARSVRDLQAASVCIQTGSTTEVVLAEISQSLHLDLKPVIFDSIQATRQAFLAERCDALITDASALASVRATLVRDPDAYVIFPADDEIEALAPSVRHGDDQWFDIVKWSFQALLLAEQWGVTQANVEARAHSGNPRIERLLGVQPGSGRALGLDDRWAYNIIRQLGNYAEVFNRNVGKDSPLKIERGPNRLTRDGGLMLPLPLN